MKISSQRNRDLCLPRSGFKGVPRLLASALFFLVANACPVPILAVESTSSTDHAAENLRNEYRQLQWSRLADAEDRDSLIAAVLLGMPDAVEQVAIKGHAEVEQRLAKRFGRDPEVVFVLALACQMQNEPCGAYYDLLTKIEPDNAVNWLLIPNGVGPNPAQLKSAAAAAYADTRLRMVVRILNAALADQPAPHPENEVDSRALALVLRVNAIERVPLPRFAGAMAVCKASALENRNDCARLGHLLSADRDGAILTKMIGSAMLRRFLKGTQEERSAFQMRREYVWLSEQLEASDGSYKVRLQSDLAKMGEWVAVQRAVERLGKSSKPSPGWTPRNPQALLLSEERTPAPEK
jgi:hypothetical protein